MKKTFKVLISEDTAEFAGCASDMFEARGSVFLVVMMSMMMFSHYFKILYNNDASEITILVAENQSVVIEPTLEF